MERENEKTSLHSPLIEEKNSNERRSEVVEEVKKQLWLAGPLVSVTLLNFCLSVISVMYVGHLGELALSGASMATSFASVTGFSLLVFPFTQLLLLLQLHCLIYSWYCYKLMFRWLYGSSRWRFRQCLDNHLD